MAVVIWVFAGGGEAEVRGLIPFLEKSFPGYQFERKTPVRNKPGPKANKVNSYGKTGKSLIEQIRRELPIALKYEPNSCDLILIFDDLDCRNPMEQKEKILAAILTIPESSNIKKIVGFAAPELEAWIIADWSNSVAKHPDFKGRHQRMCQWLSTEKSIPFDTPESFSEYDNERDCCLEKLSQALVDSSVIAEFDSSSTRFSKGLHTPALLAEIDPEVVQKKCPLFRELYNYLHDFCRSS
ncbi:DUF4276 family protein [Nodularia spumigena CS-590/01]|uniref:DUF4276 family protein n=1 Tax=Nodularia spumigena TaxID=70799 RepID=UPI00232B8750|nr:DUF4276 family protein [Nodularia spumigena]MDB9336529.1 DUF4276 family protein [Nodularia spumigena CS-590/01]